MAATDNANQEDALFSMHTAREPNPKGMGIRNRKS